MRLGDLDGDVDGDQTRGRTSGVRHGAEPTSCRDDIHESLLDIARCRCSRSRVRCRRSRRGGSKQVVQSGGMGWVGDDDVVPNAHCEGVVDEADDTSAESRLGSRKPARAGARATYSPHFWSESRWSATRKACSAFILGLSSIMARIKVMVVVEEEIWWGFCGNLGGGGVEQL